MSNHPTPTPALSNPPEASAVVSHDEVKAIVDRLCAHGGEYSPDAIERLKLAAYQCQQALSARVRDEYRAAVDCANVTLTNQRNEAWAERDSLRAKLKEAEAALRTLADCDVDEDRSTVPELLAMIVADREHVRKEAEKRAETAEQNFAAKVAEINDRCDQFRVAAETATREKWEALKEAGEAHADEARAAQSLEHLRLAISEKDERLIDELCAKANAGKATHRMVRAEEVEQARQEAYERGMADERREWESAGQSVREELDRRTP